MSDRSLERIWKAALFCGIAPLVCGLLIYTLWYFTRHPWFEWAGIANIVLGLGLFVLGIVFVVWYAWKASLAKVPWGMRCYAALGILFLNFPAAALLVSLAFNATHPYSITVDNRSTASIGQLTLHGPRDDYQIGSVEAKTRITKELEFRGEGEVTYLITIDGVEREGVLIGYISAPAHGYPIELVLREDGVVEVVEFVGGKERRRSD